MDDMEKLRVLLPHWMEHNDEHAADFVGWAAKATLAGHEDAAHMIVRAADSIGQANAGRVGWDTVRATAHAQPFTLIPKGSLGRQSPIPSA